jgi:glycosyltransferase involved in cell wall biosynthesis
MTSIKAPFDPRPVVLVSLDWYLPAYRAGGPIRSISNLVSALGDAVDFRIVCGDRDLGENLPVDAPIGEWTALGNAQVLRLPPEEWTTTRWRALIQEIEPDRLYLNSLYSGPFGRLPWRVAKSMTLPTTLAPRGMLGAGALAIKPLRKKAWLWMQHITGQYANIFWHASTTQEAKDIRRWFPAAQIQVALNLPLPFDPASKANDDGRIHLLSVGRIHTIKNYRFGLAVAKALAEQGTPVTYRIVGPLEDLDEAHRLRAEAGEVTLELTGAMPPSNVREHYAWSQLVLVPSFNENFGHAVAEGVSTARPVIVSDQTAWTDIDPGITVDCLPLQTSAWLASAKRLLAMAPADCLAHSQATHTRCLLDAHHLANQLSLFES